MYRRETALEDYSEGNAAEGRGEPGGHKKRDLDPNGLRKELREKQCLCATGSRLQKGGRGSLGVMEIPKNDKRYLGTGGSSEMSFAAFKAGYGRYLCMYLWRM